MVLKPHIKNAECIIYLFCNSQKRYRGPNCYNSRGKCYSKIEKWDSAISDHQDAVKLSRDPQLYRLDLCRTLFDAGRLEKAREGEEKCKNIRKWFCWQLNT